MASEVQIYNMALRHLGQGKTVASTDERSAGALACATFFEQVVAEVLGDFPWTFTRKFVTLALVEEDPTDEWAFSYRVPSDCLKVRRVLSGARTDDPDTVMPFMIGQDDQGALLYTDQDEAQVEYTFALDDTGRWPAAFAQAVSMLLATYIAPSVATGDTTGLRDRVMKLYMFQLAKAQALDANHGQADMPVNSAFERARA